MRASNTSSLPTRQSDVLVSGRRPRTTTLWVFTRRVGTACKVLPFQNKRSGDETTQRFRKKVAVDVNLTRPTAGVAVWLQGATCESRGSSKTSNKPGQKKVKQPWPGKLPGPPRARLSPCWRDFRLAWLMQQKYQCLLRVFHLCLETIVCHVTSPLHRVAKDVFILVSYGSQWASFSFFWFLWNVSAYNEILLLHWLCEYFFLFLAYLTGVNLFIYFFFMWCTWRHCRGYEN